MVPATATPPGGQFTTNEGEQVRKRVQRGGLTVQAIAGNHAVFFGFDLTDDARVGCLGIAIHREDHTESEAYWLAGFKTFRSVIPQPSSTAIYATDSHPIQSMWWGDYTAKPAHRYTYTVAPLYGTSKNLTRRSETEARIELTTNDPDTGAHGIYFNRGVAASQAYAARYGVPPAQLPAEKRAEAMTWLSRGLHEALRSFITRDASHDLVLRAAAYEFTDATVLAAFTQAKAAGADVQIVYHAKGDQGAANDAAIDSTGFDRSMLIPRTHPQIAHNKFIVRGTRGADGHLSGAEVWTGSTNFSQAAIFGHSNVGHAVRDPDVADSFVGYWTTLAQDPARSPLRTWVSTASPFDQATLGTPGIHTLFSPRHEIDPLDWYAHGFATAPSSTHITLPFGMDDKHFEPALAHESADGPLRFVMLDQKDNHQDTWATGQTQVAVGSAGTPEALTRWAKESLTGFNRHVPYLHTKVLLLSPLELAPTTVSGSANFSEASTTGNDENMLVITGDRDVADVYFTEYARLFQHFYARWWAAHLDPHGSDTHSFLTEDSSWQTPYWNEHSPKCRLRNLYAHMVQGQ